MPITLLKIANNTASVTIQIGEDTVTVTYFPARVTEKTIARLQSFDGIHAGASVADVHDGMSALNETLVSLIKSWDVYEDEDHLIMFPLDPERLKELPIPFRTQILGAIMQDIRPETVALQA